MTPGRSGGRRLAAAAGLGAAVLAAAPAKAAPEVFTLDPAHSFVHFEVLHFGTATLHGRFGPVQGQVTLDLEARRGEVGLAVRTAEVSTGWAVFDARLRESDLLASEEHPVAWFVARQFRFDGDRLAEVRGEFTLRGLSQPLSLVAERFRCRRPPEVPAPRCGGDFVAELRRSDFGASFGLPFIADRVLLRVQAEGVAPAR